MPMIFTVLLVVATLLVSLVAGFVFAFAVVIMPGIRELDDGDFLRAFQVMDGVIQDNQPLFVLVWLGSVVALVVAAVLGFGPLGTSGRVLLLGATALYLLGVQAPTMVINVPLNNELQAVQVSELDAEARRRLRARFEGRWNRSNQARTVLATITSAMLIALLAL